MTVPGWWRCAIGLFPRPDLRICAPRPEHAPRPLIAPRRPVNALRTASRISRFAPPAGLAHTWHGVPIRLFPACFATGRRFPASCRSVLSALPLQSRQHFLFCSLYAQWMVEISSACRVLVFFACKARRSVLQYKYIFRSKRHCKGCCAARDLQRPAGPAGTHRHCPEAWSKGVTR